MLVSRSSSSSSSSGFRRLGREAGPLSKPSSSLLYLFAAYHREDSTTIRSAIIRLRWPACTGVLVCMCVGVHTYTYARAVEEGRPCEAESGFIGRQRPRIYRYVFLAKPRETRPPARPYAPLFISLFLSFFLSSLVSILLSLSLFFSGPLSPSLSRVHIYDPVSSPRPSH